MQVSMRRIAALSAALLSATAIGTTALAGSASAAASSYSQCGSGKFCVWTEADGGGTYRYTTEDIKQLGSVLDNNIESIWNRTGSNVAIYTGANFTDRCSTIGSGTKRNLAGTAVNSVTSIDVNAAC
ncbi:hypothetical protein GCM10022223_60340 [Kineosporia mesophila]|uniref:Peptidase inhibitor family I36 n=1 Tax=Kineosporia mesophila TaxID=566012 RepID=A0ABP7AJD4_9ACTN|nr:peptidase inhibitor family I36 protein [Kineosporia mesophila]MCD5352486.1 peptidase inhibitor family I36 protein [Kineosporia mesophila]